MPYDSSFFSPKLSYRERHLVQMLWTLVLLLGLWLAQTMNANASAFVPMGNTTTGSGAKTNHSNTKGEKSDKSDKPAKSTTTKTTAQTAHKIWLSVDVVEQSASVMTNPEGGRTGEKYRADAEITITDSASAKQVFARSGDMVQLLPRRTYFVMLTGIPKIGGVPMRVQGLRTQTLRTGLPEDEDVMYERKFVLLPPNGVPASPSQKRPQSPKTSNGGQFGDTSPTIRNPNSKTNGGLNEGLSGGLNGGLNNKGFQTDQDSPSASVFGSRFTPSSAANGDMPSSAGYYVVQYCSLASEDEALEIRSMLVQQGIRDARVEVHISPTGGRFYRVRSGAFASHQQAKAFATNPVWNTKKFLNLHIKPMAIPSGL